MISAVRTKAINQQPQPGRRFSATNDCMLQICEETVTVITATHASLIRGSDMRQI
jgi:hypothetical protein